MLKIMYEYQCDLCGGEIRKPDKTELSSHHAIPVPYRLDRLGHYDACEHCLTTFYLKVDELFPGKSG